MDQDDVNMLIEIERCKIRTEQNKSDVDALSNSLRPRLTTLESEVEVLKTTSTKLYAYIAAATIAIMVLAWFIEHRNILP